MVTEKTYRHILYATDLGPNEKIIRKKVKTVKLQNDAKLSVVHIVESMPVFIDMSGYLNTAEIIQEMQKEATALVSKICKDLEVAESDQYVSIGSPKIDIVALANKIKADLIVVGTHNRHLIDKLIGSTADAILRSADCDVLTVRYRQD